ncbi:ATP-binding protein [Nonomuraea sp. MCN248]|uniref:ATP-binding protein n=1 Tax=Nonomuraea corallina TaxID=2989783 RepID=A0ABT4SG42_9ACTN|nr:ATP-binding protein [Nonomuraea corallina]MDA0636172.1 ATP-binding protein [Nonomuraea corallina]
MLPLTPQLQQVRELIEKDRYFALHAPRQTGKTTALHTLASELNAEGDTTALMFSCETARAAGDDHAAAEEILLHNLRRAADLSRLPEELLPPDPWPQVAPGSRFGAAVSEWCRRSPRRVVLILDEIDALLGSSMVSILSQLRDGHNARHEGRPFPSSMVLCGLRDLPDYKVTPAGNRDWSNPAGPFRIITESLRMGDFTTDQIAELYDQHTQATGQAFTKDAVDRVFNLTQGQPWLVNALAYEITFQMGTSGAITTAHVDEAKERLIQERPIHLDALKTRLYEPRVEQVIRAAMEGTSPVTDASFDHGLSYVRNLGLIRGTGAPEIANPIYREFLLRQWFLFADLLNREQYGPLTDEELTEAYLRIFGASHQNGGRM